MRKLNLLWTKNSHNKSQEDQARRVNHINNLMESSDTFREELGNILRPLMASSELSINYETPGWPYKRADKDGYNRAIRDILGIIGVDING